jgi:hypothetical protein
VQLTFSAILYAIFSTWLISKIQQKYLVILFHLLLTLVPATCLYNITLWKDVTAAQFVLALVLGWIIFHGYRFHFDRIGIAAVLVFAFIAFMATATRHNHIVLLFVIPIIVGLDKKWENRLKFLFLVSFWGLYALMQIPILNGALRNPQTDFQFPFEIWLLDYSYQNNSPSLTESDRAFIESVAPNSRVATQCMYWDDMYQAASGKFRENPGLSVRATDIFYREATQNPGMILAQRTCTFVGNLGLQMNRWVYWDGMGYANTSLQGNAYVRDLKPDSKLPGLHDFLGRISEWSIQFPQRYALWNHGFGILALVATALVAAYRRSWQLAGIVFIYAALVISIFLFATSIDWRYLYFLYPYSFYAIPIVMALSQPNSVSVKTIPEASAAGSI